MTGDHITFNTYGNDYNGYDFQAVSCTGDCKSGNQEPTWDTSCHDIGDQCTDNHVTWQRTKPKMGNHFTLFDIQGDTKIHYQVCAEAINEYKDFYVYSDGSLSDILSLTYIYIYDGVGLNDSILRDKSLTVVDNIGLQDAPLKIGSHK